MAFQKEQQTEQAGRSGWEVLGVGSWGGEGKVSSEFSLDPAGLGLRAGS